VASYGDGAANQGQNFEAYNMAALWKLPVIFVCENNHYGMGTSVKRAAATPDFYTRGDYLPGLRVRLASCRPLPLALTGRQIDGMNVLAAREGFRLAVEHARTQGPIVVEFDTYRYSGHSMSDPGLSYRSREEVQTYRRTRDCIELVKGWLIERNWMSADEIKARPVSHGASCTVLTACVLGQAVEKQIREEVEKVSAEVQASPFPALSEVYTDVQSA
jgi:pyruvate dehydrogenase E1 component alpha subunit